MATPSRNEDTTAPNANRGSKPEQVTPTNTVPNPKVTAHLTEDEKLDPR